MTANTIATYPDEIDVQYERTSETLDLVLDNLEQEREMHINRLNYLDRVLLKHGRISTKHVKVRAR